MDTDALDYTLPDGAIAQRPLGERSAARLLVDRGASRAVEHRSVSALPELLTAGDVVVVNTTRVLPARLALRKATGGAAEVLLVRSLDDECRVWEALIRPARRLAPGTRLVPVTATPDVVEVEIGERCEHDTFIVTLHLERPALEVLHEIGTVPLPPYITEPVEDPERYQTVFADREVSVAAPTAGLHLTEQTLAALDQRGIERAEVELAVGIGTFRPITTQHVEDHQMHAEWYRVPEATLETCRRAQERGNKVVAIGTTSVRALESAASSGQLEGRTELFIRPGHSFALVDRLLTNFHLPRSSLLVLLEAFMGSRWRSIYAEALEEGYRFLSFGDAMLCDRAPRAELRR